VVQPEVEEVRRWKPPCPPPRGGRDAPPRGGPPLAVPRPALESAVRCRRWPLGRPAPVWPWPGGDGRPSGARLPRLPRGLLPVRSDLTLFSLVKHRFCW